MTEIKSIYPILIVFCHLVVTKSTQYTGNAALFESLCEDRKGVEDEEEDNDGVVVKKDEEKDEDDDEVWDDKLANFPESLLVVSVLYF